MAIEKSREEEIVRWAEYVRANRDWKKQHTEFINAQYRKNALVAKILRKTSKGREKLKMLRYELIK